MNDQALVESAMRMFSPDELTRLASIVTSPSFERHVIAPTIGPANNHERVIAGVLPAEERADGATPILLLERGRDPDEVVSGAGKGVLLDPPGYGLLSCPRLISPRASSLLPIADAPVIRTPISRTSRNTPCSVVDSASTRAR